MGSSSKKEGELHLWDYSGSFWIPEFLRIQQPNRTGAPLFTLLTSASSDLQAALAAGISRTSLLQSKDRANKATARASTRRALQQSSSTRGTRWEISRTLPGRCDPPTAPHLNGTSQSWARWKPNVTGSSALLSSRALKKGLANHNPALSFKRELRALLILQETSSVSFYFPSNML